MMVLVAMWLAVSAAELPAKPAEGEVAKTQLVLATNEKRLLPQSDVERVAISDPAVCDASVKAEGRVELKGGKAGETSVMVWARGESSPRQYRVVVRAGK